MKNRFRLSQPIIWRLAAAVLLFAAAWPASAQSLVELHRLARSFDAAYLAAQAQAEAAESRAAQSLALKRPALALAGSAMSSRADTPMAGGLSTNSTQLALQGRQPIFNRGADATIAQAQAQLDISRLELEAVAQDLMLRLSQAYFDVLAAQDSLETARTARKGVEVQLALATRSFEVGTATVTDTREAQARLDLAAAQTIAAENELRSRQVALDQLVGRQGVLPLSLPEAATLTPSPDDGVDRWLAAAEERHPALRQARLALEIARRETDKARAARLPTVDVVASYGAGRNTGSAVSAAGGVPGTTTTASVGIQFSVPLYSGHAIDNRVQETLHLQDKAERELEGAQRAVGQSIRQAALGLASARAQAGALQAALASSRLALEATETGYRVGVRVNLDVLNAQTQLYQTRRDLARARYDVLLAELKLRRAAGALAAADLERTARVLVP